MRHWLAIFTRPRLNPRPLLTMKPFFSRDAKVLSACDLLMLHMLAAIRAEQLIGYPVPWRLAKASISVMTFRSNESSFLYAGWLNRWSGIETAIFPAYPFLVTRDLMGGRPASSRSTSRSKSSPDWF